MLGRRGWQELCFLLSCMPGLSMVAMAAAICATLTSPSLPLPLQLGGLVGLAVSLLYFLQEKIVSAGVVTCTVPQFEAVLQSLPGLRCGTLHLLCMLHVGWGQHAETSVI